MRGSPAPKLTLEFLVLTVTGSAEVGLAMRNEIDIDNRQWTHLPRASEHRSRDDRIPLGDRAFEILRGASAQRDGTRLLSRAPAETRRPT